MKSSLAWIDWTLPLGGAKDTVFDELPGAPWLGPMFSSTRSAKATAFEVTELSRSVKIEAPELVEAYWDD